MSKYTSVDNFIKSLKGEFNSEWYGFDKEYFKDKKFYVDGTCLCRVTDKVMYLSSNSLTPKCSLYLRELVVRSNELHVKVLYIPQWYQSDERSHEFSDSEIIMAFRAAILLLKNNKDIYSKTNMDDIYSTLIKIDFIPQELITEVEEILKLMNEAIHIEDKIVKKFIADNEYYELVQVAYFNKGGYDIKFRTALKNYLNPSGEYAFLTYNPEDGYVYSSECMCGQPKKTMTIDEALEIGAAYLGGTARHGQKYGNFTVMRVTDNYIQVSCNRYRKEMFQAMYTVLTRYKSMVKV